MSVLGMGEGRGRFLPPEMALSARTLPQRALGASFIVVALAGWAALASWQVADPGLGSSGAMAANWLGAKGAALADTLMQFIGLAAPAFFLPLWVLGLRIFAGLPLTETRFYLLPWLAGVVLIAAALSCLPTPDSWLLNSGLGGVLGDFVKTAFTRFGGFLEPTLASLIGGTAALAGGVWALLRACGLRLADAGMLFDTPTPHRVGAAPVRGDGPMLGRLRALLPGKHGRAAAQPYREYWMDLPKDDDFGSHWQGETASFQAAANDDADAEPFFGPGLYQRERTAPEPYPFEPAHEPQPDPAPMKAPPAPAVRWPRPAATQAVTPAAADAPLNWRIKRRPAPTAAPVIDMTEDADPDDADDEYGAAEERVSAPAFAPPPASRSVPPRAATPSATPAGWRITREVVTTAAPTVETAPRRAAPRPPQTVFPEYEPPHLSLLDPERAGAQPEQSDEVLGRRAEMLEGVLRDFGIKGAITAVQPGPVITLYEFQPARGTKSSRVIGLADDIARSMSVAAARVAVIPGRDAIGVELPNDRRALVNLRTLLETEEFAHSKAGLPLALGRTIGGLPVVADLARMPHLLIAGTTGSGKSVGINTMILSLLFRLSPQECRFIMIDPKMLELSVYDGIPHLLTPVVTDPKKAITALKWTVAEMTARYERMARLGVRNIAGFNARVARDGEDEPMPMIVVVIDEMADLMMVAGKDIEFTVQRLSQMARAAGIHLVMATQRPSVDVITGTIKANFPSRISFQVTSKIDSRTILGEQGAEQLLGQGDMLTLAAGGRIARAHGAFVSDDELERVVGHLKAQGEPDYLDDVTREPGSDADGDEDGGIGRPSSGDDVYDEAVDIVLRDRRATTSYLQRRLGVGYNRAASLIERMEADGIISAPSRTGKREILVPEAED